MRVFMRSLRAIIVSGIIVAASCAAAPAQDLPSAPSSTVAPAPKPAQNTPPQQTPAPKPEQKEQKLSLQSLEDRKKPAPNPPAENAADKEKKLANDGSLAP